MKANQSGFIIRNIGFSWIAAVVLWSLLPGVTTDFLALSFLIFVFGGATRSRLEEINTRLELNTELLADVLSKHPEFSLDEYLEDRGLQDDDS